MAQFIGYVEGQKGKASRLGSKNSGLTVTANGWGAGVTVRAKFNEKSGKDEFQVWSTEGSNRTAFGTLLGTLIDGKFIPSEVK